MSAKACATARSQSACDGSERVSKRRKQQHAPVPGAGPSNSCSSGSRSGSGSGHSSVGIGVAVDAASPLALASSIASPDHLSGTPADEPNVGVDTHSGVLRRHSTLTGDTAHKTPPTEDDKDADTLDCQQTLLQDTRSSRLLAGPQHAPLWTHLPLAVVRRILSHLGPRDQLLTDPSGLHARWQRLIQAPFPIHLAPPTDAAFAEAMANRDAAMTSPAPADPEAQRQHTVVVSAALLRAERMRLALALWTMAYVRWRAILGALAQLGPAWRTAACAHESWAAIFEHFENPLVADKMECELYTVSMECNLDPCLRTFFKATWHMDHSCIACLVSMGTTARVIQRTTEIDEAMTEEGGQECIRCGQSNFESEPVRVVAAPAGPVALCALHAALPVRYDSPEASATIPGCCRLCLQSGGTELRLASSKTSEWDAVLCHLCRFQIASQLAAPIVQRAILQSETVPAEHFRLAYTANRVRRDFVDQGTPTLHDVYWSLMEDLWLTAHAAMMVTRDDLLRHKQAVAVQKCQQLLAERLENVRASVRQEQLEAWYQSKAQRMREWERQGRVLSDAFLAQHACVPLAPRIGDKAKGKRRAKPIHPDWTIAALAQRNGLPFEHGGGTYPVTTVCEHPALVLTEPALSNSSSLQIDRSDLTPTEPASMCSSIQLGEGVALDEYVTLYGDDDEWLASQLNLELNGAFESSAETEEPWSNELRASRLFLDEYSSDSELLLDSEDEEVIALKEAHIQRVRGIPVLMPDDDRYIRMRSLENYCADSFQKGVRLIPCYRDPKTDISQIRLLVQPARAARSVWFGDFFTHRNFIWSSDLTSPRVPKLAAAPARHGSVLVAHF